jgi:hypothetical protein
MIGSFELHHDNAPANKALLFREFLAKHAFPYFGRLLILQIYLLAIFCLFPKLKLRVKGYNFQTLDSVQKAVNSHKDPNRN